MLRKFSQRIFVILNLIISGLILLACTNRWLHPDHWWFIAVLGLGFPYLLFTNFLFLLGWLLMRSRWVLLPLVTIVLAIPNIEALVGFNFKKKFELKKSGDSFRLLTWNVMWFDEQTREDKKQRSHRQEMFRFIREQQADILCFQEYLESNLTETEEYSNQEVFTKMGYPYHYIVGDYLMRRGHYQAGVAIFSKFPLQDTMRLQYPGPVAEKAAESLISADVNIHGRVMRIFTTHLQSLLFKKKDYRDLEIIRNGQDSLIGASRSILRKMRQAYSYRGYQADLVRQRLDECPYPAIICGDFNDVPNSYTYFRIRGDRIDAFNERGMGIGRTFSNLAPSLRIDYILASKQFEVKQYKCTVLPYSDHFPVVADLELTPRSE